MSKMKKAEITILCLHVTRKSALQAFMNSIGNLRAAFVRSKIITTCLSEEFYRTNSFILKKKAKNKIEIYLYERKFQKFPFHSRKRRKKGFFCC